MDSILIFLLVIGGVWAIYLVPPILNSRRETPLASTAEYSRIAARLNTVQNEGQPVSVGMSRKAVLARRRRTLATLAMAAGMSLILALTTRSLGWLFTHIAVDAGIAWYVAVLLQIKQSRTQQVIVPVGTVSSAAAHGEPQPVRVVAS
ncbi:MAG: hypothetical protein JJE47_17615 [Acidimicrobiia bacterium]|nr:hypothetical protein [Acidimicrobiia bacterium]